ncbi:MAG: nucleoside kinase [Clostridiales bacterium]|nr:nucleoside kinase [Clostridiales bacterium]
MKNIRVNGIEMQVGESTTFAQIAQEIEVPHPILLAEANNNKIYEMHRVPQNGDEIKLLDIRDFHAYMCYQRSLSFVMIYAVRQVLGEDVRVVVEHSINKNYYCEIFEDNMSMTPMALTAEMLAQIEAKMREIVAADMPITKNLFRADEAIEIVRKMKLFDKEKLLSYRIYSMIHLYSLGDFYDYFYGPMAISTGVLAKFDLETAYDGFMIIFPDRKRPEIFSEKRNVNKLAQVFKESNRWARILEIDTVGALNDKICAGQTGELIRVNEALHEKSVANIADQVLALKKSVVLIAGPTSSGKTTFSHRLAVHLQVNGLKPHVIGLDDYYVNRDQTPRDEDGNPDFESIRAIDTAQFNKDLEALLAGETVQMPKFNFLTGQREYKGHFLRMSADDVLVIEGLHGLNPELSSKVSDDAKFKVFISALTQLNLDDHNRIPASDTRKIRRLVRDNHSRGFDAKRTLEMWPSVVKGERVNIFPFQEQADVIFNSALLYEMCILKVFATPQLYAIPKSDPTYIEATRLLKFLDWFIAIPEKEVPITSLLREFIGGGVFK